VKGAAFAVHSLAVTLVPNTGAVSLSDISVSIDKLLAKSRCEYELEALDSAVMEVLGSDVAPKSYAGFLSRFWRWKEMCARRNRNIKPIKNFSTITIS